MSVTKTELIEHCKAIIGTYTTKLTLRQLFYRLVAKHILENTISQYQRLSKVLVEARHNGDIPWSAMEDRTRNAIGGDDDYESPEDHFRGWFRAFAHCDRLFKLPYWKNQDYYIEVWVEKQALQTLFQEVTDKFNITLLPTRGYSSHTVGRDFAERVNRNAGEREVVVLYFGDFDPSGEDIYRFLQDMSDRFGIDATFHKIAINPDQIKQYNIPPMMAKRSDSRFEKFAEKHGELSAVELDAIEPDVLQEIIENEILTYFDEDTREEALELQKKNREEIRNMIDEVLNAKGKKMRDGD